MERGSDAKTVGAWPGVEFAAEEGGPFLHPDQRVTRKLPIKSLRFPRSMFQLLFSRFPCGFLKPTNLLPTGVVITIQ